MCLSIAQYLSYVLLYHFFMVGVALFFAAILYKVFVNMFSPKEHLNYLYIATFICILCSTYFLNKLLLQHDEIEE